MKSNEHATNNLDNRETPVGNLTGFTKNILIKSTPAQLIVLIVAVPMGMWLDLSHDHSCTFGGNEYQLGEKFLVSVPSNLLMAMASPDCR